MMMVLDSGGSPPQRLDEGTVELVHGALRGYLSDSLDAAPLRAALVTMTAEARSRSILPEQLIILLKDMWGNLPEVRSMADVDDQTRMQQRVITMCIREYFGS